MYAKKKLKKTRVFDFCLVIEIENVVKMSNYHESLIIKYLTKSATAEDLDNLAQWVHAQDNLEEFKELIALHYCILYGLTDISMDEELQRFHGVVQKEKNKARKVQRIQIVKYVAAAIFIGCLLTTGIWLYDSVEVATPIEEKVTDTHEIEVGTDKATLTLEDGSQIALEKGKDIEVQNAKSNGVTLIYDDDKPATNVTVTYNYLTIPRGGQFFIQLSDETKVWLNSESQLKYPVHFIEGQPREVTLVYGEAYFEVSPSTQHQGASFKVMSQQQAIEVLGTQFNLKAYRDETDMYTTLVEGKVRVSYDATTTLLKPSEQSHLDMLHNQITVKEVDVYNETSWKEGVFSFDDKSLEEITKVLSRWYDMEVIIKNNTNSNKKFMGVLRKEQPIEDILAAIQGFGCFDSYTITGKTVHLN